MKWIFFVAAVCAFVFIFSSAEDLSEDAVVSLVLAQPINSPRSKRDVDVETVDLTSRGGHRRRNKHRGGSNGNLQYPSYPVGFGGSGQAGSWSSSQSQSWGNGGLGGSNSQSNSQAGANSFGGLGGSGSSASSNAGSNSWGGLGGSGSSSKSGAESHAIGGMGGQSGASSNAGSSALAHGGGIHFPGQY